MKNGQPMNARIHIATAMLQVMYQMSEGVPVRVLVQDAADAADDLLAVLDPEQHKIRLKDIKKSAKQWNDAQRRIHSR